MPGICVTTMAHDPGADRTLRILQVMKWISPREDTGGKIRSFRLGRALASFAQVDAIGYVLPGEEPDGSEEALDCYRHLWKIPACRGRTAIRQTAAALVEGFSLRTARFFPHVLSHGIEKLLGEKHYDAIQAEELPPMSSVGRLSTELPVLYSSHNIESELSLRLFRHRHPLLKMLAGRESQRTAGEEKNALRRAQACIVVSSRDRDAFRRMDTENRVPIHVLPNCAQDRFQPGPPVRGDKGVLVVGAFGWYPNRDGIRWFVAHVLPRLRRDLPRVPIRIAGSAISSRFARELRRQGLEVFADVADILPYLQTARLLCVPLRIGGGTRIKIVEAWAAGLPVVSTSLGAEGLPCRNGLDLLIADEASGFAAAVRRILEEEDLYHRLREQGLTRATDFRWAGLARPLQEIYRNVLKNRMDG